MAEKKKVDGCGDRTVGGGRGGAFGDVSPPTRFLVGCSLRFLWRALICSYCYFPWGREDKSGGERKGAMFWVRIVTDGCDIHITQTQIGGMAVRSG